MIFTTGATRRMWRAAVLAGAVLPSFCGLQAAPRQALSTGVAGAWNAPSTANLLDINSATEKQLSSLPGMGKAYALRVMAYRPYTAKNQLVTRGVLPRETYEKISALVVAKHAR